MENKLDPIIVEQPVPLGLSLDAQLVEASSLVRAPEGRARFGVDAKGTTVAVLDTGINKRHVDFAQKIAAEVNFTSSHGGNRSNARDDQGLYPMLLE